MGPLHQSSKNANERDNKQLNKMSSSSSSIMPRTEVRALTHQYPTIHNKEIQEKK